MPDLPKRRLGRTGLDVTVLGYGAMELRGAPRGREISDEQAGSILNAVLDSGINFIDTSIDYGVSEERIGKFISHRRDEYYLASKCGCLVGAAQPAGPGPNPHVFTRDNVIAGVNQSLARMKIDYLDLVQFHSSPSKAQLENEGALEALLELQQQGKVRHVGISGTIPNLDQQIEMGVFDEFQIPYSALELQHHDLIAKAAKSGAGVVIRGGVAKGAPEKEAGDPWAKWQEAGLDDLLGEMTRMEFILRFTISHPDMATTIVGTVNPDHLRANVAAAAKGPLPADIYAEARRRLGIAEPMAIETPRDGR